MEGTEEGEMNGQKLPLKSGMLIVPRVPRGHGFLQGFTLSLTLQAGTSAGTGRVPQGGHTSPAFS